MSHLATTSSEPSDATLSLSRPPNDLGPLSAPKIPGLLPEPEVSGVAGMSVDVPLRDCGSGPRT